MNSLRSFSTNVRILGRMQAILFCASLSALGMAQIGSKDPGTPMDVVYAKMSKGEARKLRKHLRSTGYNKLAGIPRVTEQNLAALTNRTYNQRRRRRAA